MWWWPIILPQEDRGGGRGKSSTDPFSKGGADDCGREGKGSLKESPISKEKRRREAPYSSTDSGRHSQLKEETRLVAAQEKTCQESEKEGNTHCFQQLNYKEDACQSACLENIHTKVKKVRSCSRSREEPVLSGNTTYWGGGGERKGGPFQGEKVSRASYSRKTAARKTYIEASRKGKKSYFSF